MNTDLNYRIFLKSKLEERCQYNPRYSLRAFARDLALSPSRLSEILNGRYGLSRVAAAGVARKLGLSEDERSHFCDLVDSEHARSRVAKAAAQARVEKRVERDSVDHEYQSLTLDAFKTISDWYHYAILELTYLEGFKNDSVWIARRLGIAEALVEPAINRLKRLEMLEETEGTLKPLEEFTATPSGVPSDALKKFHRQLLEKAMAAIVLQSPAERDFSATIMAIDRSRIGEMQTELKSIRRKFCVNQDVASSKKTAVYCLATQFFELTTNSENTQTTNQK